MFNYDLGIAWLLLFLQLKLTTMERVFRRMKYRMMKVLHLLFNQYTPRWVILVIDVLIVIFAAKSTFMLVASVEHKPFDYLNFPNSLWAVVAIQLLYILLFRSYSGLVRYSSLRDAGKQFLVVFLAVFTILLINQVLLGAYGYKLIINGGALMYGVLAFTLLFFFRVIIKSLFGLINTGSLSRSALVLGIEPGDVDMASGLMAQKSKPYKICGFINLGEETMRKRIFGKRIVTMDILYPATKTTPAIIVREDKLKALRQSRPEVFEALLDRQYKILKLPTLKEDDAAEGMIQLKQINVVDLLQRDPISLDKDLISDSYCDKTIMITGGAGSIGSEIVRQLIPFRPRKILMVDQGETPLHAMMLELEEKFPKQPYEKIVANVRNARRMQQIFDTYKPEVVFHAAAYKHVPMMECNAIEAISTNFEGTRIVAELAVAANVERFVFVSTDKAVNPTNVMGATKRSAELYIQHLVHQNRGQTSFIITRFGNVLGSNGSVVPYFKRQIEEGGPVTVTHPDITRYFMTIDEACQLVLQAGSMGHGGEIYVFDMGRPVKIVDLAKQMIRLSGLVPDRDIKIEFVGLRPGEKLYEELLADQENTSKTRHEKILIGTSVNSFSDVELKALCDQLSEAINNYDQGRAMELLRVMVPEYRPSALHAATV